MSDNLDLKAAEKAVTDIHKAFDAMKATTDEMAQEVKQYGDHRADTDAKMAKIDADLDKLQKIADEAVLAVKRSERLAETDTGAAELEAKAAKWGVSAARAFGGTGAADFTADNAANYGKVMDAYLRKGDRGMDHAEIKALSVGGDPDGGYVVHDDMSGRMVERIFETSPMRVYASSQTIGTMALDGLYDTDDMDYGWVAETESRPETSTPQLKRWRIPVHEMYSSPSATQTILDDAEIDVEAWLTGKNASRFARGENTAFVGGDGVTQPRGFLTYADRDDIETYQLQAIGRYSTGANGAFASAPDGGDVLLDTVYGIKAEYRRNSNWFMNRRTLSVVRKLKDSDGAYLWVPGARSGEPSLLMGHGVATFDDMPDIATGSLSVAFGDMRAAYQIVDRAGIRVLRDPFTNKPFVKFYSTKRVGGDVVDFDALRVIEFSE